MCKLRKAINQLKTKKMKSQFERQRDMRSAESITTDYHSSGEEDRHTVRCFRGFLKRGGPKPLGGSWKKSEYTVSSGFRLLPSRTENVRFWPAKQQFLLFFVRQLGEPWLMTTQSIAGVPINF